MNEYNNIYKVEILMIINFPFKLKLYIFISLLKLQVITLNLHMIIIFHDNHVIHFPLLSSSYFSLLHTLYSCTCISFASTQKCQCHEYY